MALNAKPSVVKMVSKSLSKKVRKKKKRKNGFAQNIAPVCGLFVFVGLVGYRNYLLSIHDSEAITLHHYKRQAPVINNHVSEGVIPLPDVLPSNIPAKLRGVYEKTITDKTIDLPDEPHQAPIEPTQRTKSSINVGIKKLEIYTPTEEEKKLANMQMRRRYDDRKKLLLEMCGNESESTWGETMQLIAAPEKNLTVCVVQKAGSTSWHKVVYELRMDEPWVKAGHNLNRAAVMVMPQTTKNKLMSSSSTTRVITVRHPFSRLISGWHNKFHKEFRLRDRYVQQVGSYAGRHTPDEDHVVAFQDFAQYLADNGIEHVDVHFRSIEQLCAPCMYPYNYIVRAETALDDLWYVLDKVNATMEGFNKHFMGNTKGDSNAVEQTLWEKDRKAVKKYFKSVPRETIEKLMSLYSHDFEKFGYTFDLDTQLIGDILD